MKSQKIIKVKKIGVKPTVDIEVDSDSHLFYGNGIVTSNSHAVSYAMNAYLSAYTKAHFSQAFFCSYLRFAKDKVDPQQEIKQLIKNANEMDIEVRLPDIRLMNKLFEIKDNVIYFGLTDIKGLGLSVYDKLIEIDKIHKISSMNYAQLMFNLLLKINSAASKALISCGALDFCNKNRTEMLFDFEICSSLTKKESEYSSVLITNNSSIKNILQYLTSHIKVNKNRKIAIQQLLISYINPPYSLIDKIEWLADNESLYLGAAISCSKLDSYDIHMINTSCKDFKQSNHYDNKKKLLIAGEITYANVIKTKSGKNPGQEMAFVTIEDQTGSLDSMIFFPEAYEKYKHHLFEENILVFAGIKAQNKDGFIVEKCFVPAS
jgi:DNA polymerase-3 subunit alpha